MTRSLMIGASLMAMTAAERAAGRYMRAPDGHGDGGDGGGAAAVAEPPEPAPEPTGEEINDPVEDVGSHRQPAAGDDSQPDDGDGGEEGGAPPKPAEPKPDDTAARLEALERRLADSERDTEYWQGRFNGTLNEDGTPVNQPQERTIAPDHPDRPNPADYTYGETDAEYIRDLARFESNLAFEERMAEQEVSRQLSEVETSHAGRVEEAKTRYADYEEKVIKGADVDPVTKEPKWFCSQLMSLGLKTSEYGPDIAYQLASNPEESRRIAQLPPLDQAKEFGRMEYIAEQSRKSEGEGGGPGRTTRVSNTPPPPPRAKGGAGTVEISPDTDNFAEFEEMADAKRKRKTR